MLVLGPSDVKKYLSMQACIQVMEDVLKSLAKGQSVQHLRSALPMTDTHIFGVMPAYLRDSNTVGAKLISVFADNHTKGLPSHQGVVVLFDATNGSVKAVVDAQSITAIRTAAVSAVATRVLSRPDSKVLGILGTGEQARSHLEAMLLVRPIERVKVWSPNREKRQAFCEDMERQFGVPITACNSPQEVAANADVICTVTASRVPVLEGDWVKPGGHVNAVGACRAADRELDTVLVKKSEFYVDRVESAIHEAGEYLLPLQEGTIAKDHIVGELGDLLLNRIPGKSSDSAITVFKSLGLAVEDLAAADYVCREAMRKMEGTQNV